MGGGVEDINLPDNISSNRGVRTFSGRAHFLFYSVIVSLNYAIGIRIIITKIKMSQEKIPKNWAIVIVHGFGRKGQDWEEGNVVPMPIDWLNKEEKELFWPPSKSEEKKFNAVPTDKWKKYVVKKVKLGKPRHQYGFYWPCISRIPPREDRVTNIIRCLDHSTCEHKISPSSPGSRQTSRRRIHSMDWFGWDEGLHTWSNGECSWRCLSHTHHCLK